MSEVLIDLYKTIKQINRPEQITFDNFLNDIQVGKWQDIVLNIRAMPSEDLQKKAKMSTPNVTLSGQFNTRYDNAIINHSGFIGIDLDEIDDPERVKQLLHGDPYVYAAFTSIRGRGLCVVFRINGDKHREAYAALSEYIFEKYEQVTDPTGVNPSRARFVSFDPYIYINAKAEKFTKLPKQKPAPKVPNVIYVQTDFDAMINEIVQRRVDITSNYRTWLNLGFAIADKFGPSGLDYFQNISQFWPNYKPDIAALQYRNCCKAKKEGVTIATFYYHAKAAGITIVSAQTKKIAQAASFSKKGGRKADAAIEYLKSAEGLPESETADIVAQVYANNIDIKDEDSIIEQLRDWLKLEFDIKRNEITKKIEVNGAEMDDVIFNDVFCGAKIMFDKINAEILQRVINSSGTITYNPFTAFFQRYAERKPKGVIREYFSCIHSDTGLGANEFFPEYVYHFGLRWLVGVISAMHYQHSPLMLVLAGKQRTGKTEFFRRLLPTELMRYYAESKLDRGNDDEILMSNKIIIFDDEMSGKSKQEENKIKSITSRDTIDLRLPYGHHAITLKRLAVLCGSTNEVANILKDLTGNRRILPVNVLSVDFDRIDKIDRVSLMMEAYWLYKDGFKWRLTEEDEKILNENTGEFESASAEAELIGRYFRHPVSPGEYGIKFYSTTDIKAFLEMKSLQKLTTTKIGIVLKDMGFTRYARKLNGYAVRGYDLIETTYPVDGLSGG